MVKTGDMIELENGMRADVMYIGEWYDGRHTVHYKHGLNFNFLIEGDESFKVIRWIEKYIN